MPSVTKIELDIQRVRDGVFRAHLEYEVTFAPEDAGLQWALRPSLVSDEGDVLFRFAETPMDVENGTTPAIGVGTSVTFSNGELDEDPAEWKWLGDGYWIPTLVQNRDEIRARLRVVAIGPILPAAVIADSEEVTGNFNR